jgi:Ca2+-binding RTX toxin-like protein
LAGAAAAPYARRNGVPHGGIADAVEMRHSARGTSNESEYPTNLSGEEKSMAKVTYGTGLGEYGFVADFYDATLQLQAGKSSETKVVYKDTGEGNDKIVIDGSGFAWEGDAMIEGTISGITFTDKEGTITYMTFKQLSLTVDEFNDAYLADGILGVQNLIMTADDTVTGSAIADEIQAGDGKDIVNAGAGADIVNGGIKADKLNGEGGNDEITGDAGNDRLWGGPGSDLFRFSDGDGKDIVVDFDAKGGGKKQDYIKLFEGEEFTIKKSGDDLVLDFGGGDTVTLLDVKKSDFTRGADIEWITL